MALRILILALAFALPVSACGSADLAPDTGGTEPLSTLPEPDGDVRTRDRDYPIASLQTAVLDSGEVEVTILAEDPGETASGIAAIQYWVWDEGGREQRFSEPFVVDSGAEITYQAVDFAAREDGPNSYVVLEGDVNAAPGEIEIDGAPVEITAEGDANQIRLAFEGQARQQVRVDLEEIDPGRAIERMVVVGPDQRSVAAWTKPREGDDDLRVRFWDAGTHTLLLKLDDDADDVTVRIRLEQLADVEATLEPTGEPLTVKIEEPGQEAYVSFEGQAGQRIRFVALDSIFESSIPEVYVQIRDPFEALVDGYPIRKRITLSRRDYELQHTGRYSVRLNPHDENTGQMTLALFDIERETTSIEADGSVVELAIEGWHDGAWLEFETESEVWLRLEVDTEGGTSACCSNALYIKDADGESLSSNVYTLVDGEVRSWASSKTPLIFSVGIDGLLYWFQVPEDGVYTIEINPDADPATRIKLSLTADEQFSPPTNR